MASRQATGSRIKTDRSGMSIRKRLLRDWRLYVLLLPALVWLIIFCYVPMYGILIAFKDYRGDLGVFWSEWVGFKYFRMFFESNIFKTVMVNTLRVSIFSLLIGFPVPILFALLVNRLNSQRFKRTVQMVTYMPNFISVVVIVSMLNIFFAPNGMANVIAKMFGAQSTITYTQPDHFLSILIGSNIWQSMGFGAIVYVAALSSVSPELYEAARIDGATTLKTIWHIDFPCILPTVIMMLILNVGSLMSVGHEKMLLMQSGMNIMSSEIISTYVYKIGLMSSQYSYATAIGLFNSVINFILLIVTNFIAKKTADIGLF